MGNTSVNQQWRTVFFNIFSPHPRGGDWKWAKAFGIISTLICHPITATAQRQLPWSRPHKHTANLPSEHPDVIEDRGLWDRDNLKERMMLDLLLENIRRLYKWDKQTGVKLRNNTSSICNAAQLSWLRFAERSNKRLAFIKSFIIKTHCIHPYTKRKKNTHK